MSHAVCPTDRRKPCKTAAGGRGRLALGSLRVSALIFAFAATPDASPEVPVAAATPLKWSLFEPFPAKPVVREPRRAPYKTPSPGVLVELMPEAEPTDWSALLERLPQAATGGTDWVRALSDGAISPKPGLVADAEDAPSLDLDVEIEPKDLPEFKATYPHKIHTQILACANCHPGIFQMERGADPITMEKIFAGEYCGRCHGKVAFEPATGCPRCHLGMPK